jgi:hypothetical protein
VSQVATTGLFTIAGVVLGGLLAISGSVYGSWHADARGLRDRKAERLRACFLPLLRTSHMLEHIVMRRRYLLGSETETERDARLETMFEEARKGIDDAQAALHVEPGPAAAEVVAKLGKLHEAFTTYGGHTRCSAQRCRCDGAAGHGNRTWRLGNSGVHRGAGAYGGDARRDGVGQPARRVLAPRGPG